MAHYFSNQENVKSNPKQIAFRMKSATVKLMTDHGIFNKGYVDQGTTALLSATNFEPHQKMLDLGCGSGVIGIYALLNDVKLVDFVDINERAVALSKENLKLNGLDAKVWESDGFKNVDDVYDLITLNPPIRAGKKVYYPLFEEAKHHLTRDGEFVIVMHKKHGASSAIKKLESIFDVVTTIKRDKGFHVIVSKFN